MKVTPVPKHKKEDAKEYREFIALHKEAMRNGSTYSSIDIPQERNLSRLVLSDPKQSGEKMFVLMAWATGATAEELQRMKWNDVAPLSGTAYLCITIPSDTSDTYRKVPLGKLLNPFLEKRLAYIKEKHKEVIASLNREEMIDFIKSLYICCDGENDLAPCDLEKAKQVTRETLLEAGVNPKVFRYTELYMKFELEDCMRPIETMQDIFLLRRTYGTVGSSFGLTAEEMSYLLKTPVRGLSADEWLAVCNAEPSILAKIAEKCGLVPFQNPLPEWYRKGELTRDIFSEKYLLQEMYKLYDLAEETL